MEAGGDGTVHPGRVSGSPAERSAELNTVCPLYWYLSKSSVLWPHCLPSRRKADIGAVKRPGCGLHHIMTDAKNKGEGRGHLGETTKEPL